MNYAEIAKEARKAVLQLIHKGQTSHISSNLGIIDVATVLFSEKKPEDEVIWSAGWKAATAYYFLAREGKIDWNDVLEKFPNEPYLALLEPSTPGVHVMSGSMGHGLPVAVGMAYAWKQEGRPGKVYCIMSDGEMNEGTTWESAAIAAQHKLDNLVVIVDKNGQQALGDTKDILNIDIFNVFRSFGWETYKIDGHHFGEISFSLHGPHGTRPKAIIAHTTKGKGIPEVEAEPLKYHYQHVDDELAKSL